MSVSYSLMNSILPTKRHLVKRQRCQAAAPGGVARASALEPSNAADRYWMQRALELADVAAAQDEVPVGAVVVAAGALLGEGWNAPIGCCDPTAHAEIRALRAAALKIGNYRLPGAVLYSTLEPCPMCAGAIVHARIARVVYAAADEKWGAGDTIEQLLDTLGVKHRIEIATGVSAVHSIARLQAFFAAKRATTKSDQG